MAIAAIKLKIMPSSPEEDIKAIEEELQLVLERHNAKNISFIEEEVAFGLKSIIATFAWPEEQDTAILENLELNGTSSTQIIDYRRAFG